MNFRKCKFLMAMVISFIAIGCKKSSNPVVPNIVFKGVYQASNTINLSAVFMYTMNGQVTNQDSIKAYLNKRPLLGDNSFFFSTTITADNSGAQVNFTDNGMVKLSKALDPANPPTEYTITQKTANGFNLEAVDTVLILNGGNVSGSSTLMSDANMLERVTDCKPITVPGYTELCTFRNAYQFIIKDGQLYFCLFSCEISTALNGSYTSSYIGNNAGSFNTGLLKQLSTGDTLIYQSKNILFKKN